MSYSTPYVEKRKTKKARLQPVNHLIDWQPIARTLEQHYIIGQNERGRKAYPALILFKMTLLQTWYNLSDYGVEDQVNDLLSCVRFCDLQLEDDVPDHSVVCRFRKAFNDSAAWEALLVPISGQLTQHNVSVKAGTISVVDASVTPTPRKLQGKPTYLLSEDPKTPPAKRCHQM